MKPYVHRRDAVLVRRSAVTFFMVLALPLLAFATLGGSVDSVRADQTHFKAKMSVIESGVYTVHQLTTPTDIVMREYVSRSGQVFGVTWRGPFIPEMRQLLGGYFPQYVTAAKAARERHVGRAPLNIQLPGLVVQTGGHMRAYFGRAYDPQLLPTGASSDDVR